MNEFTFNEFWKHMYVDDHFSFFSITLICSNFFKIPIIHVFGLKIV